MKKVLLTSIAAIAALATLTLASCNKEQQVAKMQFNATLESPAKTAIDITTGAVSWMSTDKVMIYAEGETTPAEFSVTPLDPATSASLTGSITPSSNYYAFYPSGIQASNSSVTLPSNQTYSATEVYAPMYAQGAGPNLQFKNLCGLLVLNVKSNLPIDLIHIVSDSKVINGTFNVTCGGSTDAYDPVLTAAGGNGKEIVMYPGSGITPDATNGTNFYFYLPAGTYQSGKLHIGFHPNTSDQGITKDLSGDLVIERSKYYQFSINLTFLSSIDLWYEGGLTSIVYAPGTPNETWAQAIANHDNDGWSADGGIVSYHGFCDDGEGNPYEADFYLIDADTYDYIDPNDEINTSISYAFSD